MQEVTPDINRPQWWRWPLVPFAALFGGLAGAFALAAAFWLSMKLQGGYSADGWMYRYILPGFSSGAFGWLFVTCGAAVAPKGKAITSVVLVSFFAMYVVSLLFLAWGTSYAPEWSEKIRITIACVFASIAAVSSAVQVHQEN